MSGYGDDYKDHQATKLVKEWFPSLLVGLGLDFWQKAQVAEAYRDASKLRELKKARRDLAQAESEAFRDR